MPAVFQRTLQPAPNGGPSAYELLLAEMQKPQAPASSMFTPAQVAERVGSNNQLTDLGLLGSLSPDRQMAGIGGQVFKTALANRDEKITNRGVLDPLTGQESLSPEYVHTTNEARRGKVLQQALMIEEKRQQVQDRKDLEAQKAADKADLATTLVGMRAGTTAETTALRQDLLRAQTEAAAERVRASKEAREIKAGKVLELAGHAISRAKFLDSQLALADKKVGPMTTGIIGSQLRKVPNTDAFDLAKLIDTVKAGIGFDELQQMRRESTTGGALGQVAIKELEMLQATLGNLDTSQSPAEVKRVIEQIRGHFQRISAGLGSYKGEVPRAAPATDTPPASGAAVAVPPPQPATPSPGDTTYVRNPVTGKLELVQQ